MAPFGMGPGRGMGRMRGSQVAEVNDDLCVGCGACAGACPAGAIVMEEKAVIDTASCVGCGRCARVCPAGAIRMVLRA